jgi:hypothetical protein
MRVVLRVAKVGNSIADELLSPAPPSTMTVGPEDSSSESPKTR